MAGSLSLSPGSATGHHVARRSGSRLPRLRLHYQVVLILAPAGDLLLKRGDPGFSGTGTNLIRHADASLPEGVGGAARQDGDGEESD